ncbi:ImuA family protein [Donghicola mangrovi]|nr:hypothetical protein [Donghicola mangrovi]
MKAMVNHANLLDRRPHRDGPELTLAGGLKVARARVHEICGHSRRVLALDWAGRMDGPVIWVRPKWLRDTLYPAGILPWCDPSRIITVQAPHARDILWATEESLRSGAAAAVVAELTDLPEITPVRRLHLAAERGAERGKEAPIGILLTPERGGVPAVETRWHIAPIPTKGRDPAWRLERVRARMAPPAAWTMVRGADGITLTSAPTR